MGFVGLRKCKETVLQEFKPATLQPCRLAEFQHFRKDLMLKKKSFPIQRNTRSTRMGAYDQSYLYSLRHQKRLDPHRTRSSWTGNHGTETWFLVPGKYFECSVSFSNSGKGGWRLVELLIGEDGTETKTILENPPKWLIPILPKNAVRELFPTPHE